MHRSFGFLEAAAVAICVSWSVLAIVRAPARAAESAKQDPPAVTRAAIGSTSDHRDDSEQRAGSEADLAPKTSHRTQSPLAQTMRQITEAEKLSLAELQNRFNAATDEHAALGIERQIEQLKVSTEISLLRAQADFARTQGNLQAARQIEAAIEEALHPRLPRASLDRPTPKSTRGEPGH